MGVLAMRIQYIDHDIVYSEKEHKTVYVKSQHPRAEIHFDRNNGTEVYIFKAIDAALREEGYECDLLYYDERKLSYFAVYYLMDKDDFVNLKRIYMKIKTQKHI